ncbi:jg5727 [Pararge aegeria aegeria]|uniref:Jg5727 protein n=1 Tax=Pararge aegeria aegeria TaxID=348720 RepID=A0A8S4SNF2_9NEOP|nr:jg5727 [Pararge aegeria aegeria]
MKTSHREASGPGYKTSAASGVAEASTQAADRAGEPPVPWGLPEHPWYLQHAYTPSVQMTGGCQIDHRTPHRSSSSSIQDLGASDNQGVKFLRRFKQLLNPAQVFELSGAGPRLGLRLFRHFAPLRVLVCSGDGSVGWVLQEVDKLDMHRLVQTAVLPLGTGNDLARVLGWGAACDDAANLQQLIERYERASTKMLDRWSIMTFERALTAPPPPPAPPDLLEESSLLRNLQEIVQAGECGESETSKARAALRAGCSRLATAGEKAGGGAARAAHRLRRALSLLLHARTHLAHDHARCE